MAKGYAKFNELGSLSKRNKTGNDYDNGNNLGVTVQIDPGATQYKYYRCVFLSHTKPITISIGISKLKAAIQLQFRSIQFVKRMRILITSQS